MIRLVSLAEAADVFASLPAEQQIPSLHPEYVQVDSLRDRGLESVFWLYSDSSVTCLRSFHAVETSLANGQLIRDIESAYGYGGVVCTSQDSLLRAKAHREFCCWAQKEGFLVEFCRIHPLLPNQQDFFSEKKTNREVVRILLSGNFFSAYRKKRRWSIRKELQKDIQLVCANSYSEMRLFRPLYEETMIRAGASEFYFFNDQYFEQLLALDSVKLWIAFYGNRPMSAAIILESEASGIVEYHLGAYAASSKDQPMETLLHLIAENYSNKGYKCFYLGGGRSIHQDDSLLSFKKGFSRDVISFDIGSTIFDKPKYDILRHTAKPSQPSDRIIFYRN